MEEKNLTHDTESKNLANRHNENEIKSELMPFGYDDSSLAWSVRAILENSNFFSDLDYDKLASEIERALNDSETLPDFVKSQNIKPLAETISFSRKSYFDFIFLNSSKNETMEIILRDFEKFSELPDLKFFYTKIFLSVLKKRMDDWCDIKMMDILGEDGKTNYIDLSYKIMKLYYSLTNFSPEKCSVYNSYAYKSLIRNFCELSAECVFNPGNVNLDNIFFRRSQTLETLYCIGKIPFQNCEKKRNQGYAYYNVCSPFVAETFLRTVDNLKRLLNKDRMDYIGFVPELQNLRTEILVNKMITSFSRSTSYNRFTNYRVTLNRHNSELLSIPCNELSSIEEVKPLQLFEKIISHIHFRLNEYKTNDSTDVLNVNIGVIGHAEVSYANTSGTSTCGDFREIYDLLRMVVDWYNRFCKIKTPKLDLSITYFVNEGDVLCARSLDKYDCDEVITSEYRCKDGGIGRFYVRECSYFSDFNLSKRKLRNIIEQNDVVFVLDCPWMTIESYELLSDGSLSSYCKYLGRIKGDMEPKSYMHLESDRVTRLQYLDAQYNRIISSNSQDSGLISRFFRDDYLKAIEDALKTEQTDSLRKDVYVFTSEKNGVDYSYLGSYPILRKEMYGDKVFSIAHFSNRKSEMLKLAKDGEELSFHFRLWSFLKYAAESYVSVYFRKEIDEIFSGYSLSVEDYFELMRAIVVKLTLSSDLNNICVLMGYDENIMEKIKESLHIGDDVLDILKHKLHEHIKPFIKALYEEVIFTADEVFGYNTIRKAFEMNLYESAQNVDSMFFLDLYKTRQKKKYFYDFNVSFDLEMYASFKMEEVVMEFKDKRVYQMIIEYLKETHRFDMKTNATLCYAEELAGVSMNVVFRNIAEFCRKTNQTNTDLYSNVLTALREWHD